MMNPTGVYSHFASVVPMPMYGSDLMYGPMRKMNTSKPITSQPVGHTFNGQSNIIGQVDPAFVMIKDENGVNVSRF